MNIKYSYQRRKDPTYAKTEYGGLSRIQIGGTSFILNFSNTNLPDLMKNLRPIGYKTVGEMDCFF